MGIFSIYENDNLDSKQAAICIALQAYLNLLKSLIEHLLRMQVDDSMH